MKRSVVVEFSLRPCEAEEAIWDMTSEEQIEVLKCMVDRYKNNHYRVLMQMQAIQDDLGSLIDKTERNEIIGVLEQFLLFVKGDDLCL